LGKLLGHTNWVTGVDFNPMGNILASSSRDGTVILWDLPKMAVLSGPFAVHRDWVWDIDISDNGAQLLTAGREGTLVLWNIQTNDKLGQEVNHFLTPQTVVAVSHIQEDGAAVLLTQEQLHQVNNLAQEEQGLKSLSLPSEISLGVMPPVLSPSGEWVAQTQTNLIYLWSEATGLRTLAGHDLLIQTLLFSPDSQYLISAGCTAPDVANLTVLCPSAELRVWNVATGKQVGEPIIVEELESAVLSFSPDGQWLAVAGCGRPGQGLQLQTQEAIGDKGLCGAGSTVLFRVEDLAAGQLTEVRRLTEGVDGLLQTDFITAVAFSPDNTLLATGSANGSLVFWQTETGQALTLPQSSTTGRVNAIAFNPDGQTLASVGNDPTLTLWSAQTYQRYAVQLLEHTAPIWALQYDATGDFLVTAGADGRLVLWKANLMQWQQMACQLTNRSLTNQEWMQYVGSGPNQASCP
jgi:WD40 repeat protein